jgi:hypothetical protein
VRARARAARAAALLAALALAAPGGAAGLPILDAADAQELAERLAEARAQQGVCYGWVVEVQDDAGSEDGVDQGSSLGVGTTVDPAACPRSVVLRAAVRYTSESSESEDSAGAVIDSSLDGPSVDQLERLGLGAGGLTGDANDLRLISMVEVLPLLVAEGGQAPYVQSEIGAAPAPADVVPTGAPGSDWWRMYWWFVVLVPAAAAAGIWLGVASGRRLGKRAGGSR